MFISRIQLQNWKNFSHIDVKLSKRVFLVGPNASGKSNFLDAIRFLRDVASVGGGLDNALAARGGLKKIRSLSARRKSDVEITIELSDDEGNAPTWIYSLGLRQEVTGTHRTIVSKEEVIREGNVILRRPDKDDEDDPLRLTQTFLEQINANRDFRTICIFLIETNYVHLIPQIIRQPDLFFNINVKPEEDSFGFHFIENLTRAGKGTRSARLKKIEDALKIAVPQLNNLDLVKDENGIPHLQAMYEHWRPKAGWQQESQFSDGTIRLIGLLWSILGTDSLLLLEEPEVSLHSAIVKQLPSLIYRLNRSKKRQIQTIISTHSSDLLSDRSISGEEIVLLIPESEGTMAQSAVDLPDIRALLEGGIAPYEVVIPRSAPKDINQMVLFE